MGFLTGIISAVVKTALTPVAIIKDGVNIATGNDVDATTDLLGSAAADVSGAVDDLCDGNAI